ncbi:MAG: carboxypeptidase-like regulatory domain-containing protein, partial [Bryobacteraceae bacterium]
MRFPKLCSLLLVLTALGWAQSYTAAVRGVVSDATGSGVPGAKVVITEADRNVQRPATTDSQGRFVLPALPPGGYTLTVEASGFRRHVQSAFRLEVQQQATIDIQLQIGDLATSVEVEGAAPL